MVGITGNDFIDVPFSLLELLVAANNTTTINVVQPFTFSDSLLIVAEAVSAIALILLLLFGEDIRHHYFVKPKLVLDLRLIPIQNMNLPPPHQGWRSGNVLLAFIKNEGGADAERIQASIKVSGMTRDFELLGWRYLVEQAGISGSYYMTLRRVDIPAKEDGEIWIAVKPQDGIWRAFPSFSELGGFDSYKLDNGKKYEFSIKLTGNFKPKQWSFTVSIDSKGELTHTEPSEVAESKE